MLCLFWFFRWTAPSPRTPYLSLSFEGCRIVGICLIFPSDSYSPCPVQSCVMNLPLFCMFQVRVCWFCPMAEEDTFLSCPLGKCVFKKEKKKKKNWLIFKCSHTQISPPHRVCSLKILHQNISSSIILRLFFLCTFPLSDTRTCTQTSDFIRFYEVSGVRWKVTRKFQTPVSSMCSRCVWPLPDSLVKHSSPPLGICWLLHTLSSSAPLKLSFFFLPEPKKAAKWGDWWSWLRWPASPPHSTRHSLTTWSSGCSPLR